MSKSKNNKPLDLNFDYEYVGQTYSVASAYEAGAYRISILFEIEQYNSFVINQFEWSRHFDWSCVDKYILRGLIHNQKLAEQIVKEVIRYDKLTAFK